MKKKKLTSNKKWDEEDDVTLAKDAEWTKRVNLDLPAWLINALDKEANRRGSSRQGLIKHWIVDKIDEINLKKAV